MRGAGQKDLDSNAAYCNIAGMSVGEEGVLNAIQRKDGEFVYDLSEPGDFNHSNPAVVEM